MERVHRVQDVVSSRGEGLESFESGAVVVVANVVPPKSDIRLDWLRRRPDRFPKRIRDTDTRVSFRRGAARARRASRASAPHSERHQRLAGKRARSTVVAIVDIVAREAVGIMRTTHVSRRAGTRSSPSLRRSTAYERYPAFLDDNPPPTEYNGTPRRA